MTRGRWQILAGLIVGMGFIFVNWSANIVVTQPRFWGDVVVGIAGNLAGQLLATAWMDAR